MQCRTLGRVSGHFAQLLTMVQTLVLSGYITSFDIGVSPPWPCTMTGVLGSAIFCNKLCHLLTCNIVQEVFSWSLRFMHYGYQRRRRRRTIRRRRRRRGRGRRRGRRGRRGRRNMGIVEGALYMQVHFHSEARLARCTFQSPLLHGKLCLLFFVCITAYKQPLSYYFDV